MKKFVCFVLICAFCSSLFALYRVQIGILNGPSSIPCAYAVNQNKNPDSEYEFTVFSDPQTLLPKLIKGELDAAFLPLNVAAKVYNSSSQNIQVFAITGKGNLSVITTDSSIASLSDLKGKKVYIAGQGATPEYLFRFLTSDLNIDCDFSVPTAQIVPQLLAGKIQYAVVPEPFTTIARKTNSAVTVVDLQKAYSQKTGKADYPLTVMVVRKDFAQVPALCESLLELYKNSLAWTLSNPKEAGELTETLGLGLKKEIASASIPFANYTFVFAEAPECRKLCEDLLNIFLLMDKKSVGGKLPDENFYYKHPQ